MSLPGLPTSWRNIPDPIHQAFDVVTKTLDELRRENHDLRVKLTALERRQESLESQLHQQTLSRPSPAAAQPPSRDHSHLLEVLERVQQAAQASARAAEDEADLSRRVESLDRHRAQVSSKLLSLDKSRRAREARLSDAAALLRRLAAS